MMRSMREKSKYVFYILAIAFIGWLVFDVGMGVTGRSTGSSDVVLKVNGQSVHYAEWQATYQEAAEQARRQNGGRLTREDEVDLGNRVADDLIQRSLLRQAYDRLGITVTDEEIQQAAMTSPPPEVARLAEFQVNGRFDMGKWQQYIASGSNPQFLAALEQRYREEIPYIKFLQYITADVYVPDGQLWRVYRDTHDSVTISLLAITAQMIPDSAVPVTEDEARAYFTRHQDQFKRPAEAYLSFVALPRRPNAGDSAAALSRARAVRTRLVRGAKFEEVAKTESADSGSAVQGGDLGWIRPATGGFVQPFLAALRRLRPGQLSEPVLSEFGYHLIRVDQARGDSVKVRHILIPIELQGAHRDLVESRADTLDRVAAERDNGATLDTVARRLQLPLAQAPRLFEGDRMTLGRYVIPDVSVWAFDAKVGQTSPVIEGQVAYYVFRLDSLKPGGVPPFSTVRDEVMGLARQDKRRTGVHQRAEQIAAQLRSETDLLAGAGRHGLRAARLGPFTRVSPQAELRPEPLVIGAAFALRVGERSGLIRGTAGDFLIQSLARKLADSSAWLAQRDSQRVLLLQPVRDARIRAYIAGLRAQAKIVDRRKELFKPQNATAGS
jgi:peptidyl-prolyl cis-trans isomerase D